ncbi:MAG: tyrosine--tRNA ligase, partial [Candidatus Micrarchaeota archaeon]
LEYAKEILFRAKPVMHIERPAKFGGPLDYESYAALERDYLEDRLKAPDLKAGVSSGLDALISPIRTHFEKDKKAAELVAQIKSMEVTR